MKQKKICLLQYTEYSRSPRIMRNAEALIKNNYQVDCYVLGEKSNVHKNNINGVNVIHSSVKQYRGKSIANYLYSYFIFTMWAFWKLSVKNLGRYNIIYVLNIPEMVILSVLPNKLFKTKIYQFKRAGY